MQCSRYMIEHVCESGKVLLINMISGRIQEKTPAAEKIFRLIGEGKEEEVQEEYEEELTSLKLKKFLYEKEGEEITYINEVLEQAASHDLKSCTFFLHLNYDCNLSCTYCNYKDIPKERKFMDPEGLERAFEVMRTVAANGECRQITVVLFGGEPFLPENKTVLDKFFIHYRNYKEENIKKEIQTNLLAFSNGVEIENNSTLLSANRDMISAVYVTVNGPDFIHNQTRKFPDGTGSYEKTVQGIDCLLEQQIPTWLVTNISRNNIEYLPDIHNLIEEKGWEKSSYFLGCCVSRIKNRFEEDPVCLSEYEFLNLIVRMKLSGSLKLKYFNFEDMRILKNVMALLDAEETGQESTAFRHYCIYGCGNRINQYTFSADGYIYPCSAAAGNLRYAIGQLKEEPCLQDERYWTKRPVLDKKRCTQCKAAFVCGGGCALESREKTGSWDVPFCPEAKKIVHSYLYCMEKGIDIRNRETVYEREEK